MASANALLIGSVSSLIVNCPNPPFHDFHITDARPATDWPVCTRLFAATLTLYTMDQYLAHFSMLSVLVCCRVRSRPFQRDPYTSEREPPCRLRFAQYVLCSVTVAFVNRTLNCCHGLAPTIQSITHTLSLLHTCIRQPSIRATSHKTRYGQHSVAS